MTTATGPPTTPARRRWAFMAASGAAATAMLVWLVTGGPRVGAFEPSVTLQAATVVARAVRDLAAAVAVGALALAVVVLPPEAGGSPDVLGPVRRRVLRWAGAASALWAVSGAAWLVLTYSSLSWTPLGPALLDGSLLSQLRVFVTGFELGRAHAASILLAAGVAVCSQVVRRTTPAAWLALTALVGLLPPAFTGHSASAGDHAAAVDTLVVHLVAVSLWAGGLAGLVVAAPWLGAALPVVLRRYSRLALHCFLAVAASGVLAAVVRVPSPRDLAGPYGALLAVKVLALTTAGTLGARQRRHLSVPRGPGAFVRLALGELALLALTAGVAAGLAVTPPSSAQAPTLVDPMTALLGHPMPPALDAAGWFIRWRLDSTWGPAAVLAAVAYLAGVRRLRRRGDRWPAGRTVAWLGGCAGLLWATNGVPGVYGDVLFSMHMVEHMTIGMLVPALLALAAPVSLALRCLHRREDGSRGPREWLLEVVHARYLTLLTRPPIAGGLLVGSLMGFYYTPLFTLALSTHLGHVLMTAHFLLVGYLFAWVVCGPDPGPTRPTYPLRLVMLIITMAFHAFLGVSMMSAREILGADWFARLHRPWGPSLAEDQYLGGALAWGLGDYPVAILTAALAVAWIRSDNRESRRYDRKAALDDEAELRSYNAYLASLAARHDQYERSHADRPRHTPAARDNIEK